MKKIKLGIFLSGEGTNFKSIFEFCCQKKFPAQVQIVISDRKCNGYELAKKLLKNTYHVNYDKGKNYFEKEVNTLLKQNEVELICLAGFMKILSPEFVKPWENKILNIHPSLLPLFPGLNTHEKVLESGMKIHGSTVHIVNEKIDAGKILAQCAIKIAEEDNAKLIKEKLKKYENILYPKTIEKFIFRNFKNFNKNSLKNVKTKYSKTIFSI